MAPTNQEQRPLNLESLETHMQNSDPNLSFLRLQSDLFSKVEVMPDRPKFKLTLSTLKAIA